MPYLLLADDSVTIQRVIELTFADEDVVVVAVSDGDQAIARLEASPPDIVLVDIGMPGKNGYEVAQYIRRSPRLAHIPVVLLTGAFEPVDQARADEAGCDGVLAKPFEPQLVIGRVKELLARKSRPAVALAPDVARPGTVPDDQWAPPPAPPPVSGPSAEAATPVALNDYFDRLDAAFSNMSSNTATTAAPAVSPAADIDWFTTTAAETPPAEPWDFPAPPDLMEPPDLSLAYGSPQPPAPSFPPVVTPTPADAFPQAPPPALVAFDPGAAPANFPQPVHIGPPSALADFAPDVRLAALAHPSHLPRLPQTPAAVRVVRVVRASRRRRSRRAAGTCPGGAPRGVAGARGRIRRDACRRAARAVAAERATLAWHRQSGALRHRHAAACGSGHRCPRGRHHAPRPRSPL